MVSGMALDIHSKQFPDLFRLSNQTMGYFQSSLDEAVCLEEGKDFSSLLEWL